MHTFVICKVYIMLSLAMNSLWFFLGYFLLWPKVEKYRIKRCLNVWYKLADQCGTIPNGSLLVFIYLLIFKFRAEIWTQGSVLLSSSSTACAIPSVHFASVISEMGVSWTICLGLPWTVILPISAWQVARITGMSHQCPAPFCFLNKTDLILMENVFKSKSEREIKYLFFFLLWKGIFSYLKIKKGEKYLKFVFLNKNILVLFSLSLILL
jgi:hypothetical protein